MARSLARDHELKRRHILAGAARIFSETGYDRASMSEVAAACSISKANIYHYYPSKEDILFDILDVYLSGLKHKVRANDDNSAPPQERFRSCIEDFLIAYHGADNEHKLQINELRRLPEDRQKILRNYQSDLVSHMSEIIQAIAPRRFNDNTDDLKAVTMSVFAMLNWFYMWNRKQGKQARLDYAKTIFDLTLNGIK